MKLLLYIGFLAPLLPLLFFLLFKRRSHEKAVWVIFFYIIFCAINEFTNLYLQKINSTLLLYSFSLFTVIEFSFISYYFLLIFKNKIKAGNIIKVIWSAFIIYAVWNMIFNSRMGPWDSIAMGIESIVVLILSSYYLFIKIKRTNNLSFYTNFHFWVAVTFLIYFSGTFFLNIMLETLQKNPDYQMLYFGINIGFNILKNVMLAIAMTMKLNPTKDPLPNLDDDFFLKMPNK